MTKEQAIEILQEHKEQIDKKYINTRNSKAIEKVLSMLKEKDKQIEQYQNMLATNDMLHVIECENKDKQIDLMAEYIESKKMLVDKYCYALTKEKIKQYYENKAKELLNK